MKATIEVPDELYRQVKAKSALEGRALREVAEELFRRYVDPQELPTAENDPAEQPLRRMLDGEILPSWFGFLRTQAQLVERRDIEEIRKSIAAGIVEERKL